MEINQNLMRICAVKTEIDEKKVSSSEFIEQLKTSSCILALFQCNFLVSLVSAEMPQTTKSPKDFTPYQFIGEGSYGKVYLVKENGTDQLFAMKVFNKIKLSKENVEKYVFTERHVLSLLNHPFIVKLHYSFQTDKNLYLVMDYLPGYSHSQ